MVLKIGKRALALVAAGAIASAIIALVWPTSALIVADDTGRTVWRIPVQAGEPVLLTYTNSIYAAPTWERFEVAGGRLRLIEVSSTREAVLEYHRLPPPYRYHDGRVTVATAGPVLDALPLRIGLAGRPTLSVGGTLVPLYEAGVGTSLRITISRVPRLTTITARAF